MAQQARAGRPLHTTQFYAERLGRALAYIDAHLAQPIALADLAACAAFSPFHFHRVFVDWYGETPQAYIRRYRLQRAAALLRYAHERPIASIAAQSGFTSAEAFVRAFRGYFDMTPSSWRHGHAPAGLAAALPAHAPDWPAGLSADSVRVLLLPPRRIAYQRKIGPYGEAEAALWQRLAAMLAPHGAGGGAGFGIGLDDPAVTPASRCRFDACIEIAADQALPVQVPVKMLEGGLHAVLPYHGAPSQTLGHWQWLIQCWLQQSRYSVNEQPCFQRYPQGNPVFAARHEVEGFVLPAPVLSTSGSQSSARNVAGAMPGDAPVALIQSELCLPLRRRPRQKSVINRNPG